MELALTTVNLSAPDPVALAAFYRRLLGWETQEEEPEWVLLRSVGGGLGLAFQSEPGYRPPSWPGTQGEQQMMMHLEIRVDDLPGAVEHAVASGATVSAHQPQEHVRVCLDPAGHPFCLYLDE